MKKQDRRNFLKAGGLVTIAAIVPGLGCESHEVKFRRIPMAPEPDVAPGTPVEDLPLPPITTNERFYLQSINGKNYDPGINVKRWRLRIDGLVDNPITAMTYEEIVAMPLQRQVLTMQCIGNWIGGPLVGNAEWGGTPFNNLLDMAGVRGDATRVRFASVDGYHTSIPLERALREEVLLVWEMNGEVLPSKHGFPVRLINPGHYGQKMPKWITHIDLIDFVHLGHWESLPKNKPFKWSDDAIATVNSRVDSPTSLWDDVTDPANGGVTVELQTVRGEVGEEFLVHGIAMAGERRVERVEVSADGGAYWEEAQLMTQSLPNQWVTWSYRWPLPASGRHEIVARATDDQGETQPMEDEGVDLYDGRTGWHRVPVDVESSSAS